MTVETKQTSYVFNEENRQKVQTILAKYPEDRKTSALLPLLDLMQRQCDNWLPREAMDHVAEVLGIAPIRVYEVASFYTMYNLKPVGKYLIQLCGTTPCMLCGAAELLEACKKKLDIDVGGTTNDGLFTLVEVECLGACVNAPLVQINDDYYEDLTVQQLEFIIDELKKGNDVPYGSQTKRQFSAPASGLTTLKDLP